MLITGHYRLYTLCVVSSFYLAPACFFYHQDFFSPFSSCSMILFKVFPYELVSGYGLQAGSLLVGCSERRNDSTTLTTSAWYRLTINSSASMCKTRKPFSLRARSS